MTDQPLNDPKKMTPSAPVEKKDTGPERIEPDTATRDTKTAEDVKADAEIEDRFEATDN